MAEIAEENKLTFHVGKNYKLIEDKTRGDYFYLLIETNNLFRGKNTIEINLVDTFKDKKQPAQLIDLDIYTFENESLLENTTVTSANNANYLIIFFDSILTFIDVRSKSVQFKIDLFKRDFNIEYFLSPTNLFGNKLSCLTSIDNTHNILALNNLNDLVMIKFEGNSNYKIIKSNSKSKNHETKFQSFKINKMNMIAYDKTNSKVYGFDLDQISISKSFDKNKFQINVNGLNVYGFSDDSRHFYTIENKKNLKFYDFNGAKKTAEISLYFEAQSIACSNEFLTIAVKDKRIISYLIVDKESPDKVKILECR